jgi:hypothetical protein
MLNANFIVTPLTGDVFSTNFTITNYTSGASVARYIWDPGIRNIEGEDLNTANRPNKQFIYDTPTPSFIYKLPGTYTISLTAIDFDNNFSTFSQTITANFAYRDYLRFAHIPEKYPNPGKLTNEPFKLEVLTTAIDKPLIIDLFVDNSRSTPEQFIPNKWLPISPTWKFLDKNLNTITSLSVDPIPIFKNNVIVAVSGTAEFYYVDSMSSGNPTEGCPLLITATLQTSGFVNPEDSNIYPYESHANNLTVRTGVVWQVNDLVPNTLKVTGNYIDNINTKQWKDIKIPFLISCHSNRSLILPGSDDSLSEVIFSYPQNNTLGKLSSASPFLLNLNNNEYSIDEAPLYFQATDQNDFRSGGYIFTTITPKVTAQNTSIVVQTTANYSFDVPENQFLYPGPYGVPPAIWVSNPNQNTLNKVTLMPDPYTCTTINFLRTVGILADGYVKQIEVPKKESSSTFNYEMSGFSGIYGIAIDPRNYDVIAADAELDRIYRYSNTGQLLKTLELSSLLDFDPHRKLFSSWSWHTVDPLLSSTRFILYSPNLVRPDYFAEDQISNLSLNYITVIGGVIQPNDYVGFDTTQQIFRLYVSPDYPPINQQIDLIQIFNSSYLKEYISKLKSWTIELPYPETTFSLTGNPSLSSDGNFYVVSIDGILQRPDSYIISNTTKTLTFTNTVPTSAMVHILYIPGINTPASWNFTFTEPITSITLSGNSLYKVDDKSAFIVNIGGVFQSPTNFVHNANTQELQFTTPLPVNVPIHIRQLSIPDNIYIPAAYTPSYISLDGDYNIWVSLYNTVSVLKFDPDFNLLFSAVPSSMKWPDRAWTIPPEGVDYQASLPGVRTRYVEPSGLGLDPYYNEFFLKPPVVETDQYNNCWVTYANPLCCLLVKYDSNGQSQLEIPTGKYSTPMSIAINKQNNCWISNFHGSSYEFTSLSGSLQLFDSTTGNLLSTVTGFSRPGYLTIDKNNNLWFTHSVARLGCLDTSTSTLSMWTLSTDGFTQYIFPSAFVGNNLGTYDEFENQQDEEIGGLGVDVYNRVWVLDSIRNFAWVVSATPDFLNLPIRSFKIKPDSVLGYYVDLETGETYTESKEGYQYRSAQATGDWTGNRWYQKYATPDKITTIQLSGISNSFTIEEFTNKHQIRRINESFNSAEHYKSLALPEVLKDNPVFFNEFLGSIIGTGMLSSYEDIGQKVYERIANFTINHADIETCNIDQLLSIAEQVAVPAEDYGALYPSDIRNMLDIASVPRSKLWGIKDEVPLSPQSLGEKYNTQTDLLTAGTKIYVRDKDTSEISLIQVPIEDGNLVYPLSALDGYGLKQPVLVNYIIYKFDPTYTNQYLENIIDWDSPYTTQSPYLSTITDWYGDEGGIETAFRYLLTKNLFPK